MNLLFVLYIGFDKHGPSVHLLTDIIEQSLRKGHNVKMIVRNRGGESHNIPIPLQKYDNLHCDVIYDKKLDKGALVKRYLEDIVYAFRCKKIYKNYKDTDVVFLQSCTAPLFPMLLLKKHLACPVLFNVQNIFPIDALVLNKLTMKGVKGIIFKIFRKMQQSAYKKADQIVTISEDMRKTLLGEKVEPSRLEVVYNWSYSDLAFNISDDENLFLKTHNIDLTKFRVVFAGNLGAMVNARMIADVAEICSKEPAIHFYIIGDGNNMPLLQKLARSKNLNNMSFYPYQPEEFAPHNYAMAHININALPKGIIYTCMPSKTATMLNCARPMVISVEKESAFAKMLSKVDKCEIVDVNDTVGFANAVLLKYYQHVVDNSENARLVFTEKCSKKNAKMYVEMMEQMGKNI